MHKKFFQKVITKLFLNEYFFNFFLMAVRPRVINLDFINLIGILLGSIC